MINFCPHCGAPMEDRLAFGRVRRACLACDSIFFQSPKLAAGCLVEQDGQVLLVRRRINPLRGAWCLPAGYVEYDEGPVAAAIRETHEETGLLVHVVGLEGVYHVRTDPRGWGVLVVYLALVEGGQLCGGDDASEAVFFAPTQLPPNIAFGTTRRALYRWQCRVLG
ncbi:MAG: NUDIX hydrolase [Thermoflexales bacterium]|nr:NUDIX hydrolase [Thermoflexales bacterium]